MTRDKAANAGEQEPRVGPRSAHACAGCTTMLRLAEVIERTKLGKTTLYALQKSGKFPHSVPLTPNSVRWIEAEVEAWLARQAARRALR
jgi:prophage regulatory protein